MSSDHFVGCLDLDWLELLLFTVSIFLDKGHTGDVATSILIPAVVDLCKGQKSRFVSVLLLFFFLLPW